MSQETLAGSIGVSVRELQRWEGDHRCVHMDNLHDLSEVTGIPMQVCVALNAGQPIWYSLQERRFAYSSIEKAGVPPHELFRYRENPDDEVLMRCDSIATDKQMSAILSCHHEIYGTEKPLQRDVIKTAAMILPQLNCIAFDWWGHYVGHQVCLPIKKNVYEQVRKEKGFENYLTSERIDNIIALHEGVFFYYSIFAVTTSVAYRLILESARFFAKIEEKERYLVVGFSPLTEMKKYFNFLGMRIVENTREDASKPAGLVPSIYEIKLNVLMRPHGPFGALGREVEKHDGRTGADHLIEAAKQEGLSAIATKENNGNPLSKTFSAGKREDCCPLIVDTCPSIVDKKKWDGQKVAKTQIYKFKSEACPNPKCTLYEKKAKGNIVSNGTYQANGGTLVRRFLCKECGKSFCSRAGTIFYDLRSPEERILTALKLLVKGMPLQGVAEALVIKRDTVRHWLGIAAKQSGAMNAVLMKELKVSQAELDSLWKFVKTNSLRQRAILWKRKNGFKPAP